MSLTPSNMRPLGSLAPDFALHDTLSGRTMTLQDIAGPKGTVIMFLCNHCPYVIHVNPMIVQLASEYEKLGIGFAGISSNDVEAYPQDSPVLMNIHAKNEGYTFPYLYDETQEVARAYDAACTPDFYLFDENHILVYRGRLDNSRPSRPTRDAMNTLTGEDLRSALDSLLAGRPQATDQYPSMGCNIKWKN